MTSWSSRASSPSSADRLLAILCAAALVVVVGVFAGSLLFLVAESWPALRTLGVAALLAPDGRWAPSEGAWSLLALLAASLTVMAAATLLATPLGLAAGILPRFHLRPGAALLHRRMLTTLAAVPSVVLGFFGLVSVVPVLRQFGGTGQGLLAATLVLTAMLVPTIALSTDAALARVPRELLVSGAALGLRRSTRILRLALPAAAGGIRTGIVLAAARAVGETVAVMMVAGNVVQWPQGLLEPLRTLTANLALEMGYASALHRSALFAGGLVSVIAVAALLFSLRWIGAEDRT